MKRFIFITVLLLTNTVFGQETRAQATKTLMGLGMGAQLATEVAGLTTGLGLITTPLKFAGTTSTSNILGTSSADAADSNSISIASFGGTLSVGRGAYATFNGNETTGAGDVDIASGSASGSDIRISASSTNGYVGLYTQELRRLYIDASGDIQQDATNGGDFVFNKPGEYVQMAAFVPTTAATPVAGTNIVKPGLNVVPTAAANDALFIGASTPVVGQQFRVVNSGPNAVRLKAAGGATLNGATAGGYITVATLATVDCITASATNQVCQQPVIPTPAGP